MGCKVDEMNEQEIKEAKFYLDYVGCKEGISKKNTTAWREFYLDYVGCKVVMLCVLPSGRASFISTMWDVK